MPRFLMMFTLIVLSLALAGCGTIQRWFTPTIQLDLSGVQSMTIHDDWTGLRPISPIWSTYTLTHENGAWVGSVRFVVGDGESQLSQEEAISLPAEAVEAFRNILESATPYEGEYEPFIDHFDDYPSIGIRLQTEQGEVVVYSQSQGEDAVPWGASVDGKTYIIDSGIPMEALRQLEPYLLREVRQALIDEAVAARRSSKS